MMIPNKHLSQVQTLKLHVNLRHNHHHGPVTPLQRLRSMILLPKRPRKTYLVILEAAIITYALILLLITQNYTDIDVRKNLFKPLFMRYPHSLFFSFAHIIQIFSFFGGTYIYKSSITSTKINRKAT